MSSAAITIRPATEADAEAMLAIYRPYVEQTEISFEEAVPTTEEFRARVRKYIANWACLVAEADGRVVGYAHGSAHRERAAYRWSTETTVYVAQGLHRRGVGRQLYGALMPKLRDVGYCNAYGGVALPNDASIALHLASGFKLIGTFPKVGYKSGRWVDVMWFHLPLADGSPPHAGRVTRSE